MNFLYVYLISALVIILYCKFAKDSTDMGFAFIPFINTIIVVFGILLIPMIALSRGVEKISRWVEK